jgi:hypothetical protein
MGGQNANALQQFLTFISEFYKFTAITQVGELMASVDRAVSVIIWK